MIGQFVTAQGLLHRVNEERIDQSYWLNCSNAISQFIFWSPILEFILHTILYNIL